VGERDRRRHRGRLALLPAVTAVAAAMAAGCSFKFDSAGDAWPLVGAAVDPSGLPRLTVLAGQAPHLVAGADGATWVTTGTELTTDAVRMGVARLDDPTIQAVIEALVDRTSGYQSGFEVGRSAIYGYYPGGVVIHRPGVNAHRIDLPTDNPAFSHSPSDTAYAFQDGSTLHIRRSDGSYERRFSSPPSTDVVQGWWLTWSDDGDHAQILLWREADQKFGVVIVDTRSEALIALPDVDVAPFAIRFLTDSPTALVCSTRGLLAVPLDGSATTLLDRGTCSFPDFLTLCGPDPAFDCPAVSGYGAGAHVAYVVSPPLSARQIVYLVFTGSAGAYADRVARSMTLAGGDRRESAVFRDPEVLDLHVPHVATVSDLDTLGNAFSIAGWVDGVPTVERGRALAFSADGARLRFLEHTADLIGTGDLMSGPVGGPYELVARNSIRYQELADGRLIAVTNSVYSLGGARVVLVDEAARTVTRLVEGADAYVVLPGGAEALVRLQSTDYNRPDEWRRVPLPPRGR